MNWVAINVAVAIYLICILPMGCFLGKIIVIEAFVNEDYDNLLRFLNALFSDKNAWGYIFSFLLIFICFPMIFIIIAFAIIYLAVDIVLKIVGLIKEVRRRKKHEKSIRKSIRSHSSSN